MQEFLHQYGYIALLIGTFFEGETAILIASSLIHKGIFEFPYTVLFAFIGSFASDWLYYSIGRVNGKYFVERKPKVKKWVTPVTNLFKQHQLPLLICYRFLYGFRIIIPIVIGMSGLNPMRYLMYSVLAGLFWATTVSLLGVGVGYVFDLDARSFENNLLYLVLGFSLFGLAVGLLVKRLVSLSISEEVDKVT